MVVAAESEHDWAGGVHWRYSIVQVAVVVEEVDKPRHQTSCR